MRWSAMYHTHAHMEGCGAVCWECLVVMAGLEGLTAGLLQGKGAKRKLGGSDGGATAAQFRWRTVRKK
jgi:hypothetical protein